MKRTKWLRNGLEALLPPRALIVVDGGDLPDHLRARLATSAWWKGSTLNRGRLTRG